MGFIDSYKSLEKLCSEIYSDNHGLSTYIDEMAGKPNGSYYVPGWDEDLKQLRHCRWVRNQIVHEPGCTEENMCVLEDIQCLIIFTPVSCLLVIRWHYTAKREVRRLHQNRSKIMYFNQRVIHIHNLKRLHQNLRDA